MPFGNTGKARLFPISAFLAFSDNLWLTNYIARSLNGTRCSLAAFIRAAGNVHSRSASLISSQRAPMTSPVRDHINIENSSALAAIPPVPGSRTKAPTSRYDSAA
jgi:hypothetical protein